MLELLGITPVELEREVLEGDADEHLLDWVRSHSRSLRQEEISQGNDRVLHAAPKDKSAKARFQQQIADVAKNRGVTLETLPTVMTWCDLIDLDEDRI